MSKKILSPVISRLPFLPPLLSPVVASYLGGRCSRTRTGRQGKGAAALYKDH